jgi:RHS repeat-associated protein
VEKLASGAARRVVTQPSGVSTQTVSFSDGLVTTKNPDSSKVEARQGPDPRFGFQSPTPESTVVSMPSGLKSITTHKSGAVLSTPGNPLTLQSLSDTIIVNGKAFKTTFETSTGTRTSVTPEGRIRKMTIDSAGRIVRTRVDGLDSVMYSYDERGRPDSITQGAGPGKRTQSLEYDDNGYLSKLTDASGRVFGYEYDPAGRRTKVILPDSSEILFAYDSAGNVSSISPPGKPSHDFAYTSTDQQSEYAPPSLGAGQWSTGTQYDLDHQPIRATLPESTLVDIDYDSAGRISLVQIPNATIRYAYDGVTGKIDSILSRDSIFTAYEFDGSLLKKETWSGPIGGNVAFKYNADFRVDSVRVNGSSIPYHYNQDGMITQAAGLNLVYDTKNPLLRKATLNALKDTLDYNGFGELIHQTAVNGDSALYNAAYQRDKLGRVTEKLETVGGITNRYSYEYDILGRLKTVLVDSVLFSRYHYDANGNRTARVVPGDSLVGAYDDQDRLTQYGALNYLYMPNGELAATVWGGDTTHYTYDALGNLLSVQMPGGPLIEYLIDGKNRRVGKKVNGALVQGFLYQNHLNPVAELNGSGTVVARFVYASKANVPDLVIKGGVTYRIISDQLGSPRLVIKASNDSVVQRMNYDEFGNVLLNSHPGFQPFGFAGGIYDGHTSLVRFGARDYDSWSGRWTAKDPIDFEGGNANLYAYVSNDPINLIDPYGLYDMMDFQDDAVNFSAGVGDALLFGFGDDLRSALGVEGVNECAGAYAAGGYASLAAGVGRLGYAAAAKGISIFASSGAAASVGRTQLRNLGRFGMAKNWRPPNLAGKSDAALRASAGKTNPFVNVYGAGVTVAGAVGASSCDCK